MAVTFHCNTLRNKVGTNHGIEVSRVVIVRVASVQQPFGIEVRLAAELHDAFGQPVGVAQLFIGVHHELFGDFGRLHTIGGEVVAAITEHTHQFGGQSVVKQAHDVVAPRAIGGGHGTVFEVVAGGCQAALVELHRRTLAGRNSSGFLVCSH